MEKIYDGMVVLEQPITINQNVIYGIVYNTEKEYGDGTTNTEFYKRIDRYLAYCGALSKFLQEGGEVSLDKNKWTYPNGDVIDIRNPKIRMEIISPSIGKVRYKILEYSRPLELTKDDIDTDLIINPKIIERYSISNHIIKGGKV